MKKWCFAFLLCAFSSFSVENVYKLEELNAKVILEDGSAYFLMEEGSLWRVYSFQKRWRGPIEWWNGMVLVSAEYETVPGDWYEGAPIEIHLKYDRLNAEESNASNESVLKKCSHLLVNTYTNQILFAIPQSPKQCMLDIYREGKKEGYRQGYDKGSNDSYSSGYKIGYEAGKVQGYDQAKKELERDDLREEGAPYYY